MSEGSDEGSDSTEAATTAVAAGRDPGSEAEASADAASAFVTPISQPAPSSEPAVSGAAASAPVLTPIPSTEEAPREPSSAAQEEEEIVPEEMPSPKAPLRMASHPPPPPRLRAEASAQRPMYVSGNPKVARDLMTRKLFTIAPTDLIEPLEGQMSMLHFRHLPVVDGDKVVGLISHGDLLHAFSSFLSMSAKAENVIIGKLPASRVMQREFVTARPDEPLSAIAERLWWTRAEAVLITEKDGKLVGILTKGDFVRLARHLLDRNAAADTSG